MTIELGILARKERQPLRNKNVLITGSSRGVGAAMAKRFAQDGANIFGIHGDPAKEHRQIEVAKVVESYGGTFKSICADITEPEDRSRLLQEAIEGGQKFDTVIFNASGGLERGKPPGWAEKINIEAQLALLERIFPYMNPGGIIVYITSDWAHYFGEVEQEWEEYGPIAETKYRAEQAFRQRIPVFREREISLLVVSAGIVEDTAMFTFITRAIRKNPDLAKRLRGPFLKPEDVAEAVVEMCQTPFESGFTKHVGTTQTKPL